MSGLVRVFWLGRAFLPHARIASAACGGVRLWRLSALTRRYVGVDDGFVNCGSAKGCVWPVLAPAEGIVRAGVGLRERGGFVACGGVRLWRLSALTRRYVGVDDGFVNCGPSRRYVWPVLAPAEEIVRAGVGLRERGGSRAGLCSSCAGRAILSECRVFVRAHHAFLSQCRVFVRAHHAFLSECRVFVRAHHTFLSKCRAFDHACCLPPVRQTGRLALCSVPVPPWVVIAIRAFSSVVRLSGFVGSLRDCAFSGGDPDGERRDGGTRGTESAARQSALLRDRIGFVMFSAGSPLGATRPQTCAKEPLAPWTLFI